jgi:hypothetical protein
MLRSGICATPKPQYVVTLPFFLCPASLARFDVQSEAVRHLLRTNEVGHTLPPALSSASTDALHPIRVLEFEHSVSRTSDATAYHSPLNGAAVAVTVSSEVKQQTDGGTTKLEGEEDERPASDVREWGLKEVQCWLRSLRLGQYQRAAEAHALTGSKLDRIVRSEVKLRVQVTPRHAYTYLAFTPTINT